MYSKIPEMHGPLKDIITRYIHYKRGLGYEYGNACAHRVAEIDHFFQAHGYMETKVTQEMYELYSQRRPTESEVNQNRRIGVLNGICQFMIDLGYEAFIDTSRKLSTKTDFVPYIFTDDEISRMFAELNKRVSNHNFDDCTFAMLFILYYACGLRKSEALSLRMQNINEERTILQILDSKNHKSRIIVLSDSVTGELQKYMNRYCHDLMQDDFIFRNQLGMNSPCADSKLYKQYKQLLIESSIPYRSNGRLPRIQDLRHTFCVKALRTMKQKGFDLYVSLPLLSKYLGHEHLTETEYYLRLVEEDFLSINQMMQEYSPDLFPKVGEEDE